jgi:uncharacterized protein YaaN involved in tellurite resistance
MNDLTIAKQADDVNIQNDLDKQQLLQKIHDLGMPLYHKGRKLSSMLQQPMEVLIKQAEDGGPIANSLLDLRLSVEKMDPSSIDFEGGWFTRFIGLIPGVGQPVKRYLIRFESTKTTIDSIVRSIELGRDQLIRDNAILEQDQGSMAQLINDLLSEINSMNLEEKKIEDMIQTLTGDDVDTKSKVSFLKTEVLLALRQRIVDLQQQLAVYRQAMVACGLIIKNNQELIRGVNRALNVTVSALETATTIALALANQKNVINKVQQINDTTSRLIEKTSENLKGQAVEIHKQAASTMLDTESLKRSFANLKDAIRDVDSYRQDSLPKLKQAIREIEAVNRDFI